MIPSILKIRNKEPATFAIGINYLDGHAEESQGDSGLDDLCGSGHGLGNLAGGRRHQFELAVFDKGGPTGGKES